MTTRQLPPHPSDSAPIVNLVRADIRTHCGQQVTAMYETSAAQTDKGIKRYGRVLTVDTPVDMARYACEEACDLAIYLRCKAEQCDGPERLRWLNLYRTALMLWSDVEAMTAEDGNGRAKQDAD